MSHESAFDCAGCPRRVASLEGSGVVVLHGLRSRVCPTCRRAARLARRAEVERQRWVGRMLNALRERERHERERAVQP